MARMSSQRWHFAAERLGRNAARIFSGLWHPSLRNVYPTRYSTVRQGRSPCGVATVGVTMTFEWDEGKNRANMRKHGLDFAEADTREDYGEKRWRGIGTIRGLTAVVIFAERAPETVRIISLRRAHHEEREEYEKAIHDGLEAD